MLDELVAGALEDQQARARETSLDELKAMAAQAPAPVTPSDGSGTMTAFR